MSWTDPADITGAWIGDDAPDDDSKLQIWIDKAEREIRRRVPDIQTRINVEAPATELLDSARDVVVAMVTRVFRNPEGVRQRNTTSTTGPFSDTGSVTYGGDIPGGLGLTEEELASLQGVQESGAFTIDMIPATSPFSPLYSGGVEVL